MRTKHLCALLLLLTVLSGCADRTDRQAQFRPTVLIEVPQTRQATPYTCGVAVLQSILAYNGTEYRQDILERRVGATPEAGTNPQAMIKCLEEHGIGAAFAQNITLERLRGYLDAGRPVICFLQAWNDDPEFDYSAGWEDGHYAIAIGYDSRRIYFMDPSTLANYTSIDNDKFLPRWHDGDDRHQVYQAGIVVTNPTPSYKRNAFLPML